MNVETLRGYFGHKSEFFLTRELLYLIQNVEPGLYAVPSIDDVSYESKPEPVITYREIIKIYDETSEFVTTIYVLDEDDLMLYLLNTDQDMSILVPQPDNPHHAELMGRLSIQTNIKGVRVK